MIRREEANAANIDIIHRNAAIFKTEWLTLQVTDNKFAALTQDPTKSLPLRDIVIGTFKLLEHTPVTAYGFNREGHFSEPSEDRWHAFGHHFAPKESWSTILEKPGLRSLVMEGTREGCEGTIQVRIGPSPIVALGILVAINQHHDFPTKDQQPEMTQVERNKAFLAGLKYQWDGFLSYAKSAREHLFAASASTNSRPKKKRKAK